MAFKPYCRICRSYHWPRHVCEARAGLPEDVRPVLVLTDKAVVEQLRFAALCRVLTVPITETETNVRRMLTGAVDSVREAGSNVRR